MDFHELDPLSDVTTKLDRRIVTIGHICLFVSIVRERLVPFGCISDHYGPESKPADRRRGASRITQRPYRFQLSAYRAKKCE